MEDVFEKGSLAYQLESLEDTEQDDKMNGWMRSAIYSFYNIVSMSIGLFSTGVTSTISTSQSSATAVLSFCDPQSYVFMLFIKMLVYSYAELNSKPDP